MGKIYLKGMEFYAFHGCCPEEQIAGNDFIVDIVIDYDMEKASKSDNLCDALNYAEGYELVDNEMFKRSNLLENVCRRILDRLFGRFNNMNWAEVSVAKLNPPIGGKTQSVTVCMQKKLM